MSRLQSSNNYDFDYYGEGSAAERRSQRGRKLLLVGVPIAVVAALACGIVATAIIVSKNKKKSATNADASSASLSPFKSMQRPVIVGVRPDGLPLMMTLTEQPRELPSSSSELFVAAWPPRDDNMPADGKVSLVSETYPDEAIVLAGEKKDQKRMVFHCDEDNVCRLMEIESTVTEEEEAVAVDYCSSFGAGGNDNGVSPPIDYERLKKQAGLTRKLSAILEMLPWFGEIPSEVRLCQSNLVIPLLSPMSYEETIRNVKPLDLFCTRGHTTNGKFIQMIEHMSRGSDICTHVGLFIDTSVIRLNGMVDGELYIVESVIGGDLIPGPGPVYDIAGAAVNGVQIRSLRDIMISPENEATFFTWASLKPEYRKIVERNVGLHVQAQSPSSHSSAFGRGSGGPTQSEATTKSLFSSVLSFLSAALCDDDTLSARSTPTAVATKTTVPHYQVRHIPGKVNTNCAFTRSLSKYLAKPYPSNASNFVFGMTSSKVVTGMAAKCMSEIGEDYYCSELCANLYAEVGVLPRSMIGETARTIYPVDFITAGHPSLPVLFDSYRVILSPLMTGRKAVLAK